MEWGAKQGGLMTMRAFNFLAGILNIEFKMAAAVLTGAFCNHNQSFPVLRSGMTFTAVRLAGCSW
jgi:hypothetical protein